MSLAPLDERQQLEAGLLFEKMAAATIEERAQLAAELIHLRAFADKARHERSYLPPRLQKALDDHVARPNDYALDSAAAELRGEARPTLDLEP